jgi:hypothetical protein
VVSFTPRSFYLRRKILSYRLDRRVGWFCGEETNSCPYWGSNLGSSVTHPLSYPDLDMFNSILQFMPFTFRFSDQKYVGACYMPLSSHILQDLVSVEPASGGDISNTVGSDHSDRGSCLDSGRCVSSVAYTVRRTHLHQ